MKITVWIKYEESYLPPRCRKLRYREMEEHVPLTLKEASMDDLRLAFEDVSFHGKGKIYGYKGKLWRVATGRDRFCYAGENAAEQTPLETLINTMDTSSCYFLTSWDREYYRTDTSRAAVVKKAQAALCDFLVVDGTLYIVTKEPRYCIYTFGLGHNHGGTALSVDYRYNPNISGDCYFSALQGDEAVAEADRIAARRGDTNDVGTFKAQIKVFAPDLVKVNPNQQHGKGDPFLNRLKDITSAAPVALTAGLLCIATCGKEVQK